MSELKHPYLLNPMRYFCSNFEDFPDLLFIFKEHKNKRRNHTHFKNCTFQKRPIENDWKIYLSQVG